MDISLNIFIWKCKHILWMEIAKENQFASFLYYLFLVRVYDPLRCTYRTELILKESKIPFRFFTERFLGLPGFDLFQGLSDDFCL